MKMNRCFQRVIAIFIAAAIPTLALATERYYSDKAACSPSMRYRVDANSPDNANTTNPLPSQAKFTYTCCDRLTNTILWTRKQPMRPPYRHEDGSIASYQSPSEQSPVALFVSDDGWTVIYTGWHEFIIVDIKGQDRGKVKLIEEGFTREERERHVDELTVPRWEGRDDYFFRNVGKDSLFVTRPPWGRAVIINLETGKLNDEKAASTKVIRAGDFNRPWKDPKALTRTIAYTLSLMLLPFVIGCGIWMQRRAALARTRAIPNQ